MVSCLSRCARAQSLCSSYTNPRWRLPFLSQAMCAVVGSWDDINVPIPLLCSQATASPQGSSLDPCHTLPLLCRHRLLQSSVTSVSKLPPAPALSCCSCTQCLCFCRTSSPSTQVHGIPLPLVGFPVWFSLQFSHESALPTSPTPFLTVYPLPSA